MARFINVADAGADPRIVNVDHILEVQVWARANAESGTLLRMTPVMPVGEGKTATTTSYKITLNLPFGEVIRRMQHELLVI